ncbi:MAG: DUF523 and DUF1722 domain-containing protein [Campylobacterales bacterium]|nr:DUF523 and DUF1722 domain-containing protein [Campylobacterales bacterium]
MKIAVSGCLLGEKVRFDGGHKEERFVTRELGRYMEFVSFCPEAPAFGTPRPSIRLVDVEGNVRVWSNKDNSDLTEPLQREVESQADMLSKEPLCGIILKARSPSCGLGSTKLYRTNGHTEGKSDGLFAKACKEHFALLPIEDEGRLQDLWLRENFIMAIFAYDAFERFKQEATMKALVHFHTCNKFLLQAKDETLYRQMGQLVGNAEHLAFSELLERYELLFKTAINRKSSIKRTRNVLEHMAGFFKRDLTPGEKAALREQIGDYAARLVPLAVPLSTLKLFAQKYAQHYLLEQSFLEPYPKTLALRSYIDSGR